METENMTPDQINDKIFDLQYNITGQKQALRRAVNQDKKAKWYLYEYLNAKQQIVHQGAMRYEKEELGENVTIPKIDKEKLTAQEDQALKNLENQVKGTSAEKPLNNYLTTIREIHELEDSNWDSWQRIGKQIANAAKQLGVHVSNAHGNLAIITCKVNGIGVRMNYKDFVNNPVQTLKNAADKALDKQLDQLSA